MSRQTAGIYESTEWDHDTDNPVVGSEPLREHDLTERYDEMLDEVYGTVSVCGYDYDASRALRLLDEIAYRTGFSDWLDSELSDGQLREYVA